MEGVINESERKSKLRKTCFGDPGGVARDSNRRLETAGFSCRIDVCISAAGSTRTCGDAADSGFCPLVCDIARLPRVRFILEPEEFDACGYMAHLRAAVCSCLCF